MIRPRKRKDETLAEFYERACDAYYSNGYSIIEIAEKLNIPNTMAYNYCAKPKRSFITPEVVDEVIKLKNHGYNNATIAKSTGISRTSVRRITRGKRKYDSITQDQITDDILALRVKNYSISQIAKKLGITKGKVYYRIKKAFNIPKPPQKVQQKEIDHMIFLYKSGFSIAEISRKLNRSYNTVRKYVK